MRPVAAPGAELEERPARRRVRRPGPPSTPPGSDRRARPASAFRPTALAAAGPRRAASVSPGKDDRSLGHRPDVALEPRRGELVDDLGVDCREMPASGGSPRSARVKCQPEQVADACSSPAKTRYARPGGILRTNSSNVAVWPAIPAA